MNVCPNCGNTVEEGVHFCSVCGTTVSVSAGAAPAPESAQVTCGICGAVNPAGASACSFCGAPFGTEPTAEAKTEEPKKDVMASAKEIGGKAAAAAKDIGGKAAVAAKSIGGKVKNAVPKDLGQKVKKIPKKVWMIAGGALAALVVLIILINAIAAGGGMDYNFALYVNEDAQLSYAKLNGKGDPVEITEDGTRFSSAIMAEDSKTLFYLDYNEDGELCLYYRNATNAKKDPVLLDSEVNGNFVITKDGSRVYYMKKDNLYVHNLKKSEKVESDVEGFLLAADGEKVLYQNDDGELYVWNGKKSTEVDSDVEDIYYYSDDLKTFYYLKDEDLYMKKGSKAVKVLDDCTGCSINETGKGYAMNEDDELYFIDGKKAKEVASDVYSVETMSYERSVVVFSADDGEEWYVAVNAKASELDVEDVSRIRLSTDGKTMYLLLDVKDGHGDLVKVSIGGKAGKVKEVDEDVYYSGLGFNKDGKFYYFKDVDDEGYGTLILNGKEVDTDVYCGSYGFMGNKPYYLKDLDGEEATLYVNGKEVTDGVAISSVSYNEDEKTLLFITDWEPADCEGTLNTYKSKVKVVAEEVYYSSSDYGSRDYFIMPDGQVLYFTDYDLADGEGTLNCFNGSKSVELADDAKYYIPIYAPAED